MIVHDVEQGSERWFALRAGMPTASAFGKIVKADGTLSKSITAYASQLAAELFAGKPMESFDGNGNTWMDRGKETEAEAVSTYEFTYDVAVQKVGFITNDMGTVGCSPDGLVNDDGGIEVKCLKAENHVELTSYYAKHKVAPPKYLRQVQGSLWICQRKWWDQVFFHPDLPLLVIRQAPDLEYHAALAAAVATVIAERDAALKSLKGATP